MSRDKKLTTYLGIALIGILLLIRVLRNEIEAYLATFEMNWTALGMFVAFIAITIGTVGSLTTWWSKGGDD